MPIALLSVSDKTDIVELAHGLAFRGFSLVSTGGTAQVLTAAGLQVTSVSELTGFPEMMDGRVKTLHPAIHAGILARRDRPDDIAALQHQGIALIDVVVVNLYPFAATARQAGVDVETLVEQIDIGGPSLVRAAAKNFRDVLVVVEPGDYRALLAAIDEGPTLTLRVDLMRRAFAHTAQYDETIATTLAGIKVRGESFEPFASPAERSRDVLQLSLSKIQDLRYGENPHQRAAWYRTSAAASGLGRATVLQGKELSYTNLIDLDAAMRIVLEFEVPAAAVVKHTNPCGVAIAETIADAYVRARDADRLSAFGGIVAINRPLDAEVARAIVTTKIDAVIAPDVDAAARAILERKPNMRVVAADYRGADALELRSILGAVLGQERDLVVEAGVPWAQEVLPEGFRVASRRQPTPDEWAALRFAWRVCAHVKSNSVVFANAERTLAIGAGQMSRVDAVHVAVMTVRGSKQQLAGSVAATDGFFPFRDGLDAVANAGASAVIHPGGSVRDDDVIAAADEHGLAMVFTGRRHFRH